MFFKVGLKCKPPKIFLNMLGTVLFLLFMPIVITELHSLWRSGLAEVEIDLTYLFLPYVPTVHPWTQSYIGRAADSTLGGPHTPLWHKPSQQTETGQ